MEINLISLFVVIYLGNLLSEFTFFLFNIIIQYYRMRSSRKQIDILKKNLEATIRNGIDKNDGGLK